MPLPLQTLLYVFREHQDGRQVLLGEKIRGFGCGIIMAPGGHVEPGESVTVAVIREAQEEVSVSVSEADTDRVAVLTYRFPARPSLDAEVHAFCARRWSGTIRTSDELKPIWFPVDGRTSDGSTATGRVIWGIRQSCQSTVESGRTCRSSAGATTQRGAQTAPASVEAAVNLTQQFATPSTLGNTASVPLPGGAND